MKYMTAEGGSSSFFAFCMVSRWPPGDQTGGDSDAEPKPQTAVFAAILSSFWMAVVFPLNTGRDGYGTRLSPYRRKADFLKVLFSQQQIDQRSGDEQGQDGPLHPDEDQLSDGDGDLRGKDEGMEAEKNRIEETETIPMTNLVTRGASAANKAGKNISAISTAEALAASIGSGS